MFSCILIFFFRYQLHLKMYSLPEICFKIYLIPKKNKMKAPLQHFFPLFSISTRETKKFCEYQPSRSKKKNCWKLWIIRLNSFEGWKIQKECERSAGFATIPTARATGLPCNFFFQFSFQVFSFAFSFHVN